MLLLTLSKRPTPEATVVCKNHDNRIEALPANDAPSSWVRLSGFQEYLFCRHLSRDKAALPQNFVYWRQNAETATGSHSQVASTLRKRNQIVVGWDGFWWPAGGEPRRHNSPDLTDEGFDKWEVN